MTPYRTIAIPTAAAESVRATLTSPRYGHPASAAVANSGGPCRHCLKHFRVGGEECILFTYDPFDGLERLPLPGPIFVHAKTCGRHPEDGGFPEDLRKQRLTFNAYARGRHLTAREYIEDGHVEPAIERLLARPDVDYIHVRDTGAGCYDLRIERAGSPPEDASDTERLSC